MRFIELPVTIEHGITGQETLNLAHIISFAPTARPGECFLELVGVGTRLVRVSYEDVLALVERATGRAVLAADTPDPDEHDA